MYRQNLKVVAHKYKKHNIKFSEVQWAQLGLCGKGTLSSITQILEVGIQIAILI
jgi:hypothetical protein